MLFVYKIENNIFATFSFFTLSLLFIDHCLLFIVIIHISNYPSR